MLETSCYQWSLRSTFKRPGAVVENRVMRSFTACYDETTQLRGPGFAPPGVHLFFSILFCPSPKDLPVIPDNQSSSTPATA